MGEKYAHARADLRARARGKLSPELAGSLRAARVALGMTQDQVAARAGLTQPTISRLERSERSPSRETINRLTDALQLADQVRDVLLEAARGKRSKRRRRVARRLALWRLKDRAVRSRRGGERTAIGGRPVKVATYGPSWRLLRWRRQRAG